MQNNSPKPPKTAQKAIILHTFGVQVGLCGWRPWACALLRALPRKGPENPKQAQCRPVLRFSPNGGWTEEPSPALLQSPDYHGNARLASQSNHSFMAPTSSLLFHPELPKPLHKGMPFLVYGLLLWFTILYRGPKKYQYHFEVYFRYMMLWTLLHSEPGTITLVILNSRLGWTCRKALPKLHFSAATRGYDPFLSFSLRRGRQALTRWLLGTYAGA